MSGADIVPISAIVPTRDRAEVLRRALRSLSAQGALPAELIIVDASSGEASRPAKCGTMAPA